LNELNTGGQFWQEPYIASSMSAQNTLHIIPKGPN